MAGAHCPVFSVHHSLPHRTRMLEALARLDTAVPGAAETRPDVSPSVIIWPGSGGWDADRSRARVTVLGAADMGDYIVDPRGDVQSMLTRRVIAPSRRAELSQSPLSA